MATEAKKIDDGGPAFPSGRMDQYGPQGEAIRQGYCEVGMSLRDWFAGQAIAHLSQPLVAAMHNGALPPTSEEVSKICYQLADAMLTARHFAATP
jgi:hypothetical protein